MIIRIGYDIQFDVPAEVPIVTLLKGASLARTRFGGTRHRARRTADSRSRVFWIRLGIEVFAFWRKAGPIRFHNSTLIRDSGQADEQGVTAQEIPVQELPYDVLPFLMSSRYCEVDLLLNTATELFASTPRGWGRVRAICDVGAQQRDVRLQVRERDPNGAGRVHGADRGVPRFSASGDHILPRR